MQFLLDENIHAKLAPFLREQGHGVEFVKKGNDDFEVAAHAKGQNQIILTHDTDFMDTALHPLVSHAGVVLIRINPLYLARIKHGLNDLLGQVPEAQLRCQVHLVFPDTFIKLPEERMIIL